MFNNKNFLQMRTILQNKKHLSFLGLTTLLSVALSSCSSSQQFIDTDGIYNSERYKPVPTHNESEYYVKYFEEKTQEATHFTDIDNYNSYNNGAPAWGDTTSETVVYSFDSNYYSNWMSPWHMYNGWGSMYWGWGFSFYGYGWGYPYYGYGYRWGYPYYGYGHNFYGFRNNVSYSNNIRSTPNRYISPARNTNSRIASRQLNNTTLANSRNISTARQTVQTRNQTNSNVRSTNTRYQNNNTRVNTSRNENFRNSSPTMRTSSPSTGRGMNSGGMGGGGGRSISTGGGRR